jgi:hypothetical protein
MFARKSQFSLTLLCAFAATGISSWRAASGAGEGFETAETSWKLASTDCQARLAVHQRTFTQAHSGRGSEYVAVKAAAGGSFVYLSHKIEPSRIIPELAMSVWVQSDRSGVQLLARVVLPRTEDPRSQAPLTALLFGEMLESAGEWKQLHLADFPALLDTQARVWRSQLPGIDIDTREAYVDAVVLNAYGGSGLTQLWIDDLDCSGSVSAPEFTRDPLDEGGVVGAGHTAGASSSSSSGAPVLRGAVLEADGRPLAVRAIEHQGEEFEWLKSLGFNTIKLARPPTREQCDLARRLELWLVAPPPHVLGGRRIAEAHDRVLAWELGANLAGPELEATRSLAAEVRQSDPSRRPLICSPRAKLWNYSRLADILICEPEPFNGTVELDDFSERLRERQGWARPGSPIWASLETEPSAELVAQLAAIQGEGAAPPPSIDPLQLRLVALRAAAAGARGILFRSSSRLVEGDARALALKLVNLDLELIAPWVAAGQFVAEIPASDRAARVSVLATDRSQLVLVTRTAAGQQYELEAPTNSETAFVVSGAPRSSRAYSISPAGLQFQESRRVAGGVRVAVSSAGFVKLIVLTENNLVQSHLTRTLAEHAESAAGVMRQLALARLTSVEEIDRELTSLGRVYPESLERLSEARENLRTCERLLDARDFGGAQEHAELTLAALAKIRRGRWRQAAVAFSTPVASPCCTSFDVLPLHYRLAGRLKSARWSDNVLPSGDFEDLGVLQSAGWRHYRGADATLPTAVELASHAAHSGAAGLLLKASSPDSESAGVVETPPLWITSAPVAVRARQMVRVRGWIKLPAAIQSSEGGVLIFDSAGGLPLALRFQSPGEWREFTLYRAAPTDGLFSVTFALTGVGEAWIDDLSLSLLPEGA